MSTESGKRVDEQRRSQGVATSQGAAAENRVRCASCGSDFDPETTQTEHCFECSVHLICSCADESLGNI